jgi:co-chaperonin GroES (HSP10)
MNKVNGQLFPLKDKIFVCDMHFDEEVTDSGIVLQSDNGKGEGVHPRWCRVWAIGPEQTDVEVGEWLLLEHARWSRGVTHVAQDGKETEVRMADNNAILLVSDVKPDNSTMRAVAAAAGGNFNFNIPGA